MSSAILYLAIVAIWACLLIPRMVRKSHMTPSVATDHFAEAENFVVTDSISTDAELTSAGPRPAAFPLVGDELGARRSGLLRSVGLLSSLPAMPDWEELEEPEADTAPMAPIRIPEPAAEPAPAGQPVAASGMTEGSARQLTPAYPPVSRSKILQARRRLLTTLVLLAFAAATCTALKLTSGWVCVPPAGMLGMYLLLLREASLADAEKARWRAEQAHEADAARQRARDCSREAWAARSPQPSAEIIDISARLGDQLYDQYADATARAVGD